MNKFHDLSGENKNQLLILVDEKGKALGTATSEVCHAGIGRLHLAFAAFIVNSKSKIILTKRSEKKSLWPGYWDASTISHVLPGETVESAATRRGKEELGISVEFKDLGAFFYTERYGENAENEYCHILVGRSRETPDFNPVEITEIRNISFADLKNEIKTKPDIFTPWLKIAVEKITINE